MYGRDSELIKLNNTRNDPTKSNAVRLKADKTRQQILDQMRDKRLMGMRLRLIQASRAGDVIEMAKISAQMKDYLNEDRETGHYGI